MTLSEEAATLLCGAVIACKAAMTRSLPGLLGMVTLLVAAVADAAPNNKSPAKKGATYYSKLCAGCHGVDGRGVGPEAKGLITKPADLTRIAARRKGKFSAEEIRRIIDGRYRKPSEGSTPMPSWGAALGNQRASLDASTREHRTRVIIGDLVAYLRSIQISSRP